MSLKVAYLVNQYPKVSHSFIRREILALEAQGLSILRFSIRSCAAELVDEADQQELAKTRFILQVGAIGLLLGLLKTAVQRPVAWLKTLKTALQLGWHSEQGLLKHGAYFAEACVLLQWLTEAGVDHLHAHFGTNSATVAMLCHGLGGPDYSFTVHGPEEFDKVRAIGLPEKIQQAAFVIAISQFGRSQLYRWCAAKAWSKIQVVRCGVDQMFLNAQPPAIPDLPRLVCVGRLCEDKGQLLLVEAVKQLKDQGCPVQLVLVGDGELRPELEARITAAGLTEQITITGWANGEAVRQHVLSARAMVLPSFAEGLPVVIMEALALGRPVISTTIAGIPELVQPDCGWLVPPSSVEALVTTIQTVIHAPIDQLQEMGRMGALRVAQQHDANREAHQLAKLFRAYSTATKLSLDESSLSTHLPTVTNS